MSRRGSTSSGACLTVSVLVAAVAVPCLGQQVTGQWDFNSGDLRATAGTAGQYWIPAPPSRDIEAETQFGTTTSFGIPDIGGVPAHVMHFPQTDPSMGYAMYPQIEANGGGEYVNQFTLIMDILYPAGSDGVYRSLLQTSECNTNDGDAFIDDADALGINGEYAGQILPNTWYRIALAFDLAASGGPTLAKYIDGVQVAVQILPEGLDARWSLYTQIDGYPALLFTDESNETASGYVNSIQIRNYTMTDTEVAALGGASATGIPGGTGVTGQWDFELGNLSATSGRDLVYFRGCQYGCNQNLEAETHFGPASSFGLPRINRVDPVVMQFPQITPCAGYLITHGAAPNGGGAYVNQYTLIMDVLFPSIASDSYAGLYQTYMANTNDGDWFIQGSDHGLGINAVYGGTVPDGTWNRLALAVDLEHGTVTSYINGTQASQWGGESIDGRFALDPTFLLFADDNGETAPGYVNSVQFRDYAMAAPEILDLGGPTAAGIGQQDPRLAPDANGDGYVNQADFEEFLGCLTAPTIPVPPEKQFLCRNFDADSDGDIDQADFGMFQQYYTGTATCAPNCYYP